jgi:hypothetical protein
MELSMSNLIDSTRTDKITSWPEYRCWSNIKQLCYNAKNPRYFDYGGRGITVCDEWLNSFENFYNSVGVRPSKEYILGREDVNIGYTPSNSKWMMPIDQARNKRNTKCPQLIGEHMSTRQLAAKCGVNQSTVSRRLRNGEAVTSALRPARKLESRTYTFNGEKKTLAEWAKIYNVSYANLYNRVIALGWSLEKAISK